MKDIMVDLETMGVGANAAITAIGAVVFDPLAAPGEGLGAEFYRAVHLESSVALGGVMDPGTVLWWLSQTEAARRELTHADQDGALPGSAPGTDMRVLLREALGDFTSFVAFEAAASSTRMWGNGASFDCVILRTAYKRANMTEPWPFYRDRDMRTIKELPDALGFEVAPAPPRGTAHHALDDARYQAIVVQDIYRGLRGVDY